MQKTTGPGEFVDEYSAILRVETPLEFLDRFLLNHEIHEAGLVSYIEIQDEFVSLSIEGRNDSYLDTHLQNRTKLLKEIELTRKDIANLKLEIETEKASPSDEPMVFRLANRLGHL